MFDSFFFKYEQKYAVSHVYLDTGISKLGIVHGRARWTHFILYQVTRNNHMRPFLCTTFTSSAPYIFLLLFRLR